MSASILTKATAAVHAVDDQSPHGSFEAIISTPSLDRDGDRLTPDGWKTPLPEHIPISVNHAMTADSIIGSGRPFLDQAGSLRVRGTFASTELGQTVRSLVNDGHLRTLSVEFLEERTQKGVGGKRELVGASLVYLPSNRDARVLSSKAAAAVEDFADQSADAAEDDQPPANDLDPDLLAELVSAVSALPTVADEDVPTALADVGEVLGELSAPYVEDGGSEPQADAESKSAAVSAKVKAMLSALE